MLSSNLFFQKKLTLIIFIALAISSNNIFAETGESQQYTNTEQAIANIGSDVILGTARTDLETNITAYEKVLRDRPDSINMILQENKELLKKLKVGDLILSSMNPIGLAAEQIRIEKEGRSQGDKRYSIIMDLVLDDIAPCYIGPMNSDGLKLFKGALEDSANTAWNNIQHKKQSAHELLSRDIPQFFEAIQSEARAGRISNIDDLRHKFEGSRQELLSKSRKLQDDSSSRIEKAIAWFYKKTDNIEATMETEQANLQYMLPILDGDGFKQRATIAIQNGIAERKEILEYAQKLVAYENTIQKTAIKYKRQDNKKSKTTAFVIPPFKNANVSSMLQNNPPYYCILEKGIKVTVLSTLPKKTETFNVDGKILPVEADQGFVDIVVDEGICKGKQGFIDISFLKTVSDSNVSCEPK